MQLIKENIARRLKLELEEEDMGLWIRQTYAVSSQRLDGSWTTIGRSHQRSTADMLFKINGG